MIRAGGQGGGNRSVKGVGGTEAMVEEQCCAGRGVLGWEVGVEDATVRDGEVWHDQLQKKRR